MGGGHAPGAAAALLRAPTPEAAAQGREGPVRGQALTLSRSRSRSLALALILSPPLSQAAERAQIEALARAAAEADAKQRAITQAEEAKAQAIIQVILTP